jgi:putative FmdB family regulatory protein
VTYEYGCKRCSLVFVVNNKRPEDKECACPDCGNMARRLISRTSFSLKGDGWAKDGYS